ncbi:MAG: sterol desaturase family protein [Hydrogenophilaceae bacterium]|jgi:sterol desaturase/sphingolipid hydroxylase (fatty acid hydroxylase superfamily)|nr:sterol desaturase family protein [Hydrogenophilaceae bacterium]
MIPAELQATLEKLDVVTLAVPAFVALVILEMIVVRVTKKGRYNALDSGTSLVMGLGNTIAGVFFGGLVVAGHFFVYQYRLFDIPWAWWSMVLCFFGEDLCYYWFHRIAHERRWFWASHVVHHTSQHYNLTTALRQTWTGAISFSWIFYLPLTLVGFPPLMIFLFSGVSLVYQFWIHTETIGRLGPLEWVMNTPSHHRVHHATNPRYLDANYAGVLIIWDRLFGTFVAERADDPPRYGIISNLGTFNPIRVAFHEWAGIFRDVRSARSVGEVIGYVFGPPGWSPDGSRKTSASIKAEWRAREAAHVAAE